MGDQIQIQEKVWLSAIKAGDAQAFDELFRFYGKRLYYFAFGYLKSKEEAEEVVQEVFFRIWRNRKDLKPELSFKAYLFKIAYHHILELFQKINRKQAYRHQIIEEAVQFTVELDERVDYHSLLELVEKVIGNLPARQKEILIKRKKEGMPVKEISQQLGIAPKTVENHLTKALKTLKSALKEEMKISGLLFFMLFFYR